MSFGLANVIAAIFVENTLAAAKHNGVIAKRRRLLDMDMFTDAAGSLVRFIWHTHEQIQKGETPELLDIEVKGRALSQAEVERAAVLQITPEFFKTLCSFWEFKHIMEELDISEEDQVGLFDTLDIDGSGTLDLQELIVGIAKLRGEARRSDIVEVGLVARSLQAHVRRLERLCEAAIGTTAKRSASHHDTLGRGGVPMAIPGIVG
mmetsp:Transcript_5820/g.16845  ORF Transcript_5820/g.16845 Transcript_5820/m.16845 type:complete len:206 (+) Transcript_5820:2-619(+)